MEFDAEQGFELLFNTLLNEQSGVVRAAIGRSIAATNETVPKVNEKLRSSVARERESACFLASWFSGDLDHEIQRCLDDEDPDVARSAVKSLIRRRPQQMSDEIAAELQTEVDFTRKCCLVDDLLETADLSDSFRSLPERVRSAIDSMHSLLKDDAWRKIQRLRKENYDQLAKERR